MDNDQLSLEPIQLMPTNNIAVIYIFQYLLMTWLQLGRIYGNKPDEVDFKRGMLLISQYRPFLYGIDLEKAELFFPQFLEHFRGLKLKLTKPSWQFYRRCVLATVPNITELSKEVILEILDVDDN